MSHRGFFVVASKAFFAPNDAAPPKAPNPTALPPTMRAGMSAAKGNIPPFCWFFLFLLFSIRFLRVLRQRLGIVSK